MTPDFVRTLAARWSRLARRRSMPPELLPGPIHGEPLGAERLAERARTLAAQQRLAPDVARRRPTPLLARLQETRAILERAHERLSAATQAKLDVGPAAEWFLDNYYLVQEQISEVRDSLPRGYYRELPELADGQLAGYPRVYEIATTLISHTEGRIDPDNVDLFVGAFQERTPLSIGELWALPAMLRLALIENVRRMTLRTVQRLDQMELAERWAAHLLRADALGREEFADALRDLMTGHPPLTPVFVSQFLHRIRAENAAFTALAWLEPWFAEEGLSADEALARSTEHLALTQVGMANSITSLRTIARIDWHAVVERESRMEAVLREDPSGIYPQMTFATRDKYRHVVETIARGARVSEVAVARRAIDLARQAQAETPDAPHRAHVGYWLVDEGRTELEHAVGYRPSLSARVHRLVLGHPNVVFVGGIVVATAGALAALLWLGGPEARQAWPVVVLLGLLPAGEIAVRWVNQIITTFLPPATLPKLEFREQGIPDWCRTAVVVPTLFPNVEAVREALDHIEAQFLANRDPNLRFAILSDFTDAPAEHMEGDDEILAAAVEGIQALNARYGGGDRGPFLLFHRPRLWNPKQGVWMGWERKRGKLAQFNRFVRGAEDGAFSVIVGDVESIRGVRYVITLDADTVLPPEGAALLIGTIAHPLNRAVYDERGTIVRGYGIIQPRVGISLPSAFRSRFAAIHSGRPGVDPYTTAVSDVYQDLYREGSYTGKGIYDVDAFERATHGRFPTNTLLSHDLIEGNYARAGLATTIEVFDDYPMRYLAWARRLHRWIRGDWQLLRWLTRWVPGPDGLERNRLSLLSRWKILDNLRRSLVEISQLVFLVAGWTFLPGSPVRWTLLGVAAIGAPWIIALLIALVRVPIDKSWRTYYAALARDAKTSAAQVALALVFLPHIAWVSADAIVRTLWRLAVSKRNLLEWQTASQIEKSITPRLSFAWRQLAPAVAIAVVLLGAIGARAMLRESAGAAAGSWPTWHLLAAVPLLVLWGLSPVISHVISRAPGRPELPLTPAQRADAMRYALLHWRWFERFVTAETQWLAPDNFQEDPAPVVAMRTSPTNIGLQLMAIASAYDLGFITRAAMAERLELAFRSLERMRRFRGHFYNWYDLRDLHVLEPAYISTVDSGNLAGHLIAVQQACLQARHGRDDDARVWEALDTAVALAAESVRTALSGTGDSRELHEQVRKALAAASVALQRVRTDIRSHVERADEPTAEVLDAFGREMEAARVALAGAIRATGADATSQSADALERIAWCIRFIGDRRAAFAQPRDEVDDRLEALAERAGRLVEEMDFGFLYDDENELFAIGFRHDTYTRDQSHYDLLASEARLASFLAVARRDAPPEHWFRLGRTLRAAGGETALVSWSGSMFEYLMPLLVMRSYPSTVLDQSCHAAVRRQISYGTERGVPWGVSESAYNLRDRQFTYQYRAFGVPDLALKRGLAQELVIAPYASVLAMMLDPHRALANLAVLERKGALGPWGFRDALDYARPDPGRRFALVRTYMAHHIGMSLAALTNVLRDRVWQQRFHASPLVRSVEVLLHERMPRRLELQQARPEVAPEALPEPELERPAVREVDTPDTPQPVIALLGHVPYTLMVSAAGSGYSRFEGLAVTRWRSDGTRDDTGQFCYLRDVATGRVWSATYHPTRVRADEYQARLATDRASFYRVDGDIETRTEIVSVPADAAEVRRITLTNNSDEPREIELTSYGEIVLAPPETERAHPAFANLFVETEFHEWCSAITATRRPRSATERSLWLVHVVAPGPDAVGPVTCETDRARFLGRGRGTDDPAALDGDGPLSGTTGAVLDPIFALRTRVRIEPRQSTTVSFATLVATSRERCFELADRYHDPHAAQRALDLAWTAAQIELRELGVSPTVAAVFQELAGHLFFAHPPLRPIAEELMRNRGSQPLLWSVGVSGDWPILLATIDSALGLPTLRQLFMAHHYWRRRGMIVDLVVLDEHPVSYADDLREKLVSAVLASGEGGVLDRPGGVFLRRRDQLSEDELGMLRATARVHIHCDGAGLGRILDAAGEEVIETPTPAPPERPVRTTPPATRIVRGLRALAGRAQRAASQLAGKEAETVAAPGEVRTEDDGRHRVRPSTALAFDNRFGGLRAGLDYEIRLHGRETTPAPWINVIANPVGGFLVSERGSSCTWALNSQFFRLTPWHNDPVTDPASEVLWLRDEDTGEFWSATPAPIRHDTPYIVRHGAGRSTFEHEHAGIHTELVMGMAEGEAVKLQILRITNRDARRRRLSVTAYVEWTLGVLREHTRHQVSTWFDARLETIFARNTFNPDFAEWVAFCALSEPLAGHTGDRREFLGRNGAPATPAGMHADVLSGLTGAAIDPCAAMRCVLELDPGDTREVVVVLGAAPDDAAARRAARTYRDVSHAAAALDRSMAAWHDRLGVIQVRTPEPSLDAMLNRWALYQALSCRMWGRAALYQSSGAYGFRDQLQDSMAFVYAEPGVARAHILLAASRQFVEGDVQHWWHPPSGRGVRTRFSDDLAWLPYVVDHYVRVTGDAAILDEVVPFITMRQLEPHEHEVYDLPAVADERASVYEHCLRALRKACTEGPHGLPLIGIGDWNDGMNRVGVEGRGESVWLAWFLIANLRAFARHAEARGDADVAADFRRRADAYAAAVEEHAWDGAWYRRAWFDDGTPLGSAQSDECRIDAIAQSWSVISGAGAPERQAQAMRSLEQYLVREDARLIMLLTPPFDRTPKDPGYIKGYLPGVRENGAQYTHAALWTVLATAMRGNGDRALELFQMINPLTHARTPEEVATYVVEPYVVAADVYTAKGHLGRGGWTWYTGSASWLYRVGLEAILGFTKRGDVLTIAPCVPRDWTEYEIEYRFGRSTYRIRVMPGSLPEGERPEVRLDGRVLGTPEIPLVDDGQRHEVEVRTPPRTTAAPPETSTAAEDGRGGRDPGPVPMDPYTMATDLLGDIALTPGQVAQLRALNTKYFTELAAMQRGDPRAPRSVAELQAMIASDIRDILPEEEREAFDRRLASAMDGRDPTETR